MGRGGSRPEIAIFGLRGPFRVPGPSWIDPGRRDEISQNPDLELRGMGPKKTRNYIFPADFRARPGNCRNGSQSSDFLYFTTRDGPGGRPGTSPNLGAKWTLQNSPLPLLFDPWRWEKGGGAEMGSL